jgi:hypothetical protein
MSNFTFFIGEQVVGRDFNALLYDLSWREELSPAFTCLSLELDRWVTLWFWIMEFSCFV